MHSGQWKIDNIAGVTNVKITLNIRNCWITGRTAVKTFERICQKRWCRLQKTINSAMLRLKWCDWCDVQADNGCFHKTFKNLQAPGKILATDYDLGRMGSAYLDNDYVNLWVSDPAKRSEWNSGNQLRNDGVDIYKSNTNEYYVGKTESGEWLQYTINAKTDKTYTFDFNYASSNAAKIRIEDASGKQLSTVSLASTGGNENWKTLSVKGISLKKEKIKSGSISKMMV